MARTCSYQTQKRSTEPLNKKRRVFRFQNELDVSEDEERFFVVEKLLKKRIYKGREEYLVRWLNYPPEEDTWEPRSELEVNSIDLIIDFNKEPPREETNRLHCICHKTYKFDQGGMIQCFNCLTWYHFSCIKMNMEEANSFARYYCVDCRKINPKLKNQIKEEKLRSRYGKFLDQE